MSESVNKPIQKSEEISLVELINTFKKYWNYLLSKWLIILIFGLSGGALGLIASFIVKPKYTAHLSFALVEKSSGGGLADLASSFGFGGMMGGSNSVFSGDNLLEIIQSRHAVEQTLLTPIEYKNKKQNLVEVYIDFQDLREDWSKSKNAELRNLEYPVGQKREDFSRIQDSVLFKIYDKIIKSGSLIISKKEKKVSIVDVEFISEDESFSKIFVENLMNETYSFYKETKLSQTQANVDKMQQTADSIRDLYEAALMKSAGISQVNINQAIQTAAVPRVKQENNAQLYRTVYAEVLKNLETLKLDLARETPIVQIIDVPRFPLKKDRLGHLKGIVFGVLIGGVLIILYLLIKLYFLNLVKK